MAQMQETACNVGDPGSIPRSGRSPGRGHGNPLQHSCLENSIGRGAWQATVCGVTESDMTERVTHTHTDVLLVNVYVLVAQSCPTLCNPMDCSPSAFSVYRIFPGRNTEVGCHFLLQGIFLTQGSNSHLFHLLHWQVDSLPVGSPGKSLLTPSYLITAKTVKVS